LVPADKKLYALRDVTATVDCIPLIASSIMSKKVAEGIDALVLDVKVGSGAFMKTMEQARALARTLIELGAQMGRRVTGLLTDMDQPLGQAVGNSLEVAEAIDVLRGAGPRDLTQLTLALGAEMLVLGGVAASSSEAMEQLENAVRSGAGLAKLRQVVERQGGDAGVIDEPGRLPSAAAVAEVLSPGDGYVARIDAEAIGLAAMTLGAGRERVDSVIDPSVGLILLRKMGEPVQAGQPLARIHYNQKERVKDVSNRILHAFQIEPSPPPQRPLIYEHLR
jgi:pyrimidine-nucleoside phosphorylase